MGSINNIPKTLIFLNSIIEKESVELQNKTDFLVEVDSYLNSINQMENIINQNKIVNLESFQKICEILKLNDPKSFNNIKVYNELLNNELFDYQKGIAQQQILNSLDLFKKNLLKSKNEVMTIVSIKQDSVALYQKIINEISNNDCKIISEQVLNALSDIIKKSELNEKKQFELIFEISVLNANLMKQNIELLAMRKRAQNKKVSISTEVKPSKGLVDSSEEHIKELIIQIATIVQTYNEKTPLVDLVLDKVNDAMSLEDKLLLITSPNDIDSKLLCIAFYIKEKILNQLSEQYLSEELITELESLLFEYDQCLVAKSKIKNEKSVSDILRENGFVSQVPLYEEIKSFLIDMEFDLFSHYNGYYSQEKYSELVEGYSNLLSVLKDYEAAIQLYTEDNSMDVVEMTYDSLISMYKHVSSMYESKIEVEKSIDEEDLNTGIEFYSENSPVKNIYVFLNDDSGVSDIEEEILDDPSLPNDSMVSVISTLKERINSNFSTADDHKIKSNNYSEIFMRKYKPKSIKNHKIRMAHSLFSTTLDSKFGFSEPPHLVFILGVCNGRTDTDTKHESFEKALKKCYMNKEKIDRIVELFNTDWSKLTDAEANERIEVINKYLKEQKIKIGHMINSTKKKKESKTNGTY